MSIFLLESNQINMFYAKKRISTGRYVAEREPGGARFLRKGSEPALEQRMNSGDSFPEQIRRSTGVNGRIRDCDDKLFRRAEYGNGGGKGNRINQGGNAGCPVPLWDWISGV